VLVAASLGQAAADHVADGEDRDIQPRLVSAEALTVLVLVHHRRGDQDAEGDDDVGDQLGGLEGRLRLSRGGVVPRVVVVGPVGGVASHVISR